MRTMIDRRQMMAAMASLPVVGGLAGAGPVTIFEARRFITMEPSLPSARFVAVADGIILGLADTLEALAPWTRGRETRLDRRFADRIVMPGLIDPHVHPMQSAVMLNIPFLAPDDWQLPGGSYPGVRTAAGYRERLAALIAGSSDTPFICWGYHELFHGPLDRQALDAIAPDRPVVVWQRSFHDIYVNSAMLDAWGLTDPGRFAAALGSADTAHADHGRGWFSETALPAAIALLRPHIMAPAKIGAGMAQLRQILTSVGVTTVSDMGTGIFAGFDAEAQLIRHAFERDDAAARVMLMPLALELAGTADVGTWYASASARCAARHVRMDRRVKMLADGAFFAQNMRMNAPGYTDGHIGKWITEPDVLAAQIERFRAADFDLHIHVNGDEGLDVVLDALARAPQRTGLTVTLEHLGYSTEAQNRRIAAMGLMVSAQPNYIRVLGDVYASNGLGPDRAATINRLGSLERKGVPLGLHSDFNMAPIDPLYLAWVAANRITLDGNQLAPAERLSRDKALRAITIEAAQVIGMDALVGSIAAGKKADFAVLDRDPLAVDIAALRDVRVSSVVYEGRVIEA